MLRKFQAAEPDVSKLIRSFYRKYVVVEYSRAILLRASDIRSTYHVSYWDSLILASAVTANATTLYTEDLHDGLIVDNRLTIVNPFKVSTQS